VARFKNTSGDAREVPMLADLGLPTIVDADEIIEVPDDIAAGLVWPEETWQATKAPSKAAVKATDQGEGE
jgi:hypothetical protein